ncbi:hypothetical protein [Gymnodinialimonas ulvae]|uniref:hypothetical protein n=1 Tax=Gymnodinialimonas ulvae TaxID=3126504 RepID=UPI00309C03BC
MTTRSPSALARIILRLALLIGVVALATWGAHEIRDALDLQIRPDNEQQVHRFVMFVAVGYILLLAIPFVPGAEIGIAMLTAFGPIIAPLVYICTVAAMMLAFTIGRYLRPETLARALAVVRMRRAADLVARAADLPPQDRLALFEGDAPGGIRKLGLRYRYVALALAVNTPGNSIIGGGGGIMMMAGLTGIFSPLTTLLTVALAVAPVPLAVIFLGLQL